MEKFKKVLISLGVALFVYLVMIIQATVMNNVLLFNVKANLFILLIVFLSSYLGKFTYYTILIITGILIDISVGIRVGITSISTIFALTALEYLENIFYENNEIITIIKIIITTFIYEVLFYIIRIGIHNYSFELNMFSTTLMVEILYNSLIGIVIYPFINIIGKYIQKYYKKSNILTRYF